MSELINTHDNRATIRWKLLTGASALVLTAYVSSINAVHAADRPLIWIEGGWQFESITGSNDILVPPLDDLTTNGFSSTPTAANFLGQSSGGFPSFTGIENVLGHSSGAEGSISFQPKDSNWILSISGRYGHTHGHKHIERRRDAYSEPANVTNILGHYVKTQHFTNYVNQSANNSESHAVVDFQVGRDVGLGLFGQRTDSTVSFGARYMRFDQSGSGHAYDNPAVRFYHHKGAAPKYQYNIAFRYQKSATLLERDASFRALGPSLSWTNATRLWGDLEGGEVALDWGANAAVLFGRQKAKVNYSTKTFTTYYGGGVHSSNSRPFHRTDSRRVTVPNVGGFAGLSYRFTDARLSLGYRADFFFHALDRGLDTRRIATIGFNGPYASISIGLP